MPDPNRRLTPANQNPWYVLMTLYGEQEGEEVDWDLHEKNRQAWNAWACQGMTEEERRKAAEETGKTFEEMSAWPNIGEEIVKLYRNEVVKRRGKDRCICPHL
jgi:hypothetical protein